MRHVVRSLRRDDFERGFLDLLAQLTTVGDATPAEIDRRLGEIQSNGDYVLHVVEEVATGRVVACATLLIERKFVRSCGKVGHIEDVAVDASCRGMGLGKQLLTTLVDVARAEGCYKVILDCAEENVGFYEKCGLRRKELQMAKYF